MIVSSTVVAVTSRQLRAPRHHDSSTSVPVSRLLADKGGGGLDDRRLLEKNVDHSDRELYPRSDSDVTIKRG